MVSLTEIVLSSKGQMVIPKEFTDLLGLKPKPKQRLEIELLWDGTLLVIPIPEDVTEAMRLPAAEKLEPALTEEREGRRTCQRYGPGVENRVKVFLDTWVLIEKYKGNSDAERLLEDATNKFEAYISHITAAELMNLISREYGERQARIQYAYIKRCPLKCNPITEKCAREAGLLKTKYKFSLADALILSTALVIEADVLVTGGVKQYEEEWKTVTEMQVLKLCDFIDSGSQR